MARFEDCLATEVAHHRQEWSERAADLEAERVRRAETVAANREAIESFLAAMEAASVPPMVWKARRISVDDKEHRLRPMKGWVFSEGGYHRLVAPDGSVHSLTGVRRGTGRRDTIVNPEPASLEDRLLVGGLVALYRSVTGQPDHRIVTAPPP